MTEQSKVKAGPRRHTSFWEEIRLYAGFLWVLGACWFPRWLHLDLALAQVYGPLESQTDPISPF